MFDLTAKKKLKQCEINEDVEHWSWISSTVLGVVGKTSVYHVDISNSSATATKMFDRDARM